MSTQEQDVVHFFSFHFTHASTVHLDRYDGIDVDVLALVPGNHDMVSCLTVGEAKFQPHITRPRARALPELKALAGPGPLVFVQTGLQRTVESHAGGGVSLAKRQWQLARFDEGPTPERPPVEDAHLFLQIGRRIAELRVERGFSTLDFAAKLRIDVRHLTRIEHGTENLTMKTLNRIAEALRVGVGDLLVPPRSLTRPGRGRPRKH